MKTCPRCNSDIKEEDIICPACGLDLTKPYEPGDAVHTEHVEPEKEETSTPQKPKKKAGKIILVPLITVAVIVAGLLIIGSVSMRKGTTVVSNNVTGRVIEQDFPGDSANLAISENIYDFTFTLAGDVYAIPCSLSKFTDRGWKISGTSTTTDEELAANETKALTIEKDGVRISVCAYNPWNENKKLGECKIYEITVNEDKTEFTYLNGCDIHTEPLKVIENAGPATDFFASDAKMVLDYVNPAGDNSKIHISRESGKACSTVVLTNRILFDVIYFDKLDPMQFTICGKTYTMPCSVEAMLNDGWKFTGNVTAEDSVPGHDKVGATLECNGEKVTVYLYNANGFAKPARYCRIGEITFDNKSIVTLFGEITGRITSEDVINFLGDANDVRSGNGSTTYYYYTDATTENGFTFTEKSDGTYFIKLKCAVMYDNETVSDRAKRPDFYDEYETPGTINKDSDPVSFAIAGDSYRLPTPVSEFVEDGWLIVASEGDVYGGAELSISLYKEGILLDCTVKNFSDSMLTPADCAIVGVRASSYNNAYIEIPGGAKIGMTKDEAATALGDMYTWSDMGQFSFAASDGGRITIFVDSSTGEVRSMLLERHNWQ